MTALCRDVHRGYNLWDEARGCSDGNKVSPKGLCWTIEEASPLGLSDCDANPLGRPLLVGAEGLRTGQQWFHTDCGISRQQRAASLGGLRFSD